jgi:GNAT superfamily N-acetyltransferase
MVTQTPIVNLGATQITDAGRVLGRAFWDDPAAIYILPDDDRRARPLSWFFTHAAQYGDLFGEVYTTAGQVEGAAIWLPPGEAEVTEERMAEAGLDQLPEVFGEESFGRFEHMLGHLETLHQRDLPEPHWYLFILGVDPPRQGQGVGGALLQPVLQRADADGLPCYLETMKLRNLPFYQKHGFRVVVDSVLPDSSLRFWTMKRDPN